MADEDNKLLNSTKVNDNPLKKERDEYFTKLEKWLQETYAWQSIAIMFPYYLMSGTRLLPQISNNVSTLPNNQMNTQNSNLRPRNTAEYGGNGPISRADGYEYQIPPIWKRFVAEMIDLLMLFVLKLLITFVALDILAAMNMEPYTLDTLQSSLRIVDYKMAMEVISRILVWELMHRFIVCVFEAFWLQHGMNGRIGGATPGKSMMGLRVVQCRSITPLEQINGTELVLVTPGTDLGLPLAFGRSIVKNLTLALLFPICFSLFSFRFNRTGYDLACHSLVVEDPYRNLNNNNIINNNNNNINRPQRQ